MISKVINFYNKMRQILYSKLIFLQIIFIAEIIFSGCASVGPEKVITDRIDYTQALSESWKKQMLLNLVKLRYGDAPIFLDVVSVISSYELSGSADLGGTLTISPNNEGETSVGVRGFFADRPTITYRPVTGEDFAKSIMSPIPTTALINLLQAGYPADLVFRVFVQSVNGIKNKYSGTATQYIGDPRFYAICNKLRQIQLNGSIGMKVEKTDGEIVTMVVFNSGGNADIESDIDSIKNVLGLDSTVNEFKVEYGLIQNNNKEIAILSRSVLQVLQHLASYIDVPESHIKEYRAFPSYRNQLNSDLKIRPLLKVKSSVEEPKDSFFKVSYHGYWFWIDDKDLFSKQIFSFLMFTFNLGETNTGKEAPVVTVPVR